MHTEFVQFLVQRETGRLGCDFEQHAAGLAEINGMKISAIDYWRDVVAKIDEMLAPLELFGLVLCSKRNVMSLNRPRRGPSRCRADTAGRQFFPAQSRPGIQTETGCPIRQPNDSRSSR